MATLLQLHFAFNGPFGDAMAEQLKPLADEKSALAYLEKHTARLKNLGVEEVVAKVFDVNEPLSQINQAKLA